MSEKQEQEANYFALCILIPRKQLNDEIEKLQPFDFCDDSKLNSLCKIFGVTHAMMIERLKNL